MKSNCAGSGQAGVIVDDSGSWMCPVCKQMFKRNRVNTDTLRVHKAKRDPDALTLFELRRQEQCPTVE